VAIEVVVVVAIEAAPVAIEAAPVAIEVVVAADSPCFLFLSLDINSEY